MTRLEDLTDGDRVKVDGGFECMPEGVQWVSRDDGGELFVLCREGRHYLAGQEDEEGNLIGIEKVC